MLAGAHKKFECRQHTEMYLQALKHNGIGMELSPEMVSFCGVAALLSISLNSFWRNHLKFVFETNVQYSVTDTYNLV